MNVINTPVLILGAFLVGSSIGGVAAYKYQTSKYEAIFVKQQAIAQETLRIKTEEVTKVQRELVDQKHTLELQYAAQISEIKDTNTRLTTMLDNGFRLRDNASAGCDDTLSRASRTTRVPTARSKGTEFSRDATEKLLSEAKRADEILAKLKVCQAWVKSATEKLKK